MRKAIDNGEVAPIKNKSKGVMVLAVRGWVYIVNSTTESKTIVIKLMEYVFCV